MAAEEIARWPGIGLAESALHAPSVDETVATIERVAARTISERQLADWLRATRT